MQTPKRDIRTGWGLALGLMLAATTPAAAQRAQGLYDESRVLQHRQGECRGIPDCVTIESRERRVPKGQSVTLNLHCPAATPYVVNWDTEQNEHLAVTAKPLLVDLTAPAVAGSPPGGGSSRLSLAVVNNGDSVGRVTAFLGCAASPPRIAAVMRHRSGVPSNHGVFQGGSR
jgi:hypothetical protein